MKSRLKFGNRTFLLTANGGKGCLSSKRGILSTFVADMLDADACIEVDSILRTARKSAILFRYDTSAGTLLETVTGIIRESFRL